MRLPLSVEMACAADSEVVYITNANVLPCVNFSSLMSPNGEHSVRSSRSSQLGARLPRYTEQLPCSVCPAPCAPCSAATAALASSKVAKPTRMTREPRVAPCMSWMAFSAEWRWKKETKP